MTVTIQQQLIIQVGNSAKGPDAAGTHSTCTKESLQYTVLFFSDIAPISHIPHSYNFSYQSPFFFSNWKY